MKNIKTIVEKLFSFAILHNANGIIRFSDEDNFWIDGIDGDVVGNRNISIHVKCMYIKDGKITLAEDDNEISIDELSHQGMSIVCGHLTDCIEPIICEYATNAKRYEQH